MSTFLFVGGFSDGKRMSVPDMKVIKVPTDKLREFEVYRAERFAAESSEHTVYVLDSWGTDKALAALLTHYHPK